MRGAKSDPVGYVGVHAKKLVTGLTGAYRAIDDMRLDCTLQLREIVCRFILSGLDKVAVC